MKISLMYLFLPLFFCIFLACPLKKKNEPTYVTLQNNSNQGFYYCFSYDYPNIALNGVEDKPQGTGSYIDINQKKIVIPTSRLDKYSTIVLFLINKDTLEKNIWDTIKKRNIFIKNIIITKDYLKNNNWAITYP